MHMIVHTIWGERREVRRCDEEEGRLLASSGRLESAEQTDDCQTFRQSHQPTKMRSCRAPKSLSHCDGESNADSGGSRGLS
jgi:hypothetical protein